MSAMHISQPENGKETIYHVVKKGKYQKTIPRQAGEKKESQCYRCGRQDHFAKDPTCPARGQECRKCRGAIHLHLKCVKPKM